ncbi:MAG: carbohydrate binding domain-containing protein, partial [Candidatus Saccharimonadales bacterium]
MNQASRISSQEMHKRTTQFVLVVGLILMTFGLLGADRQAQAATSSYFNFQMRLLTSSGAVVADGNYHIEFKLYNAANSTGSSQGSCSGDANCLWTETRTTGNLVRLVNGYFSVQLGSVTALPSINWNQELWLGVRIGGSAGAASWETIELTSDGTATGNKIALTAVPYAFTARELQMTSGSFTNTLLFATPSGSSKTITIPNETGTICTTGSVCTGYQASGSYYLQGGNSFGATAVLGTNDSNSLTFETNNTTQVTIAVGGATTFQNSTNSTTAFQIQNAAGTSLFNANTSTVVQLVNNNSMETSINGWVAKGSSTISSDNSVAAQFGSFYLKAATTAAIGDGAAYRVPLKASTQYSLSVWARLSSGSATTINFGRQDNAVDVDCLTGQTVNTTWT